MHVVCLQVAVATCLVVRKQYIVAPTCLLFLAHSVATIGCCNLIGCTKAAYWLHRFYANPLNNPCDFCTKFMNQRFVQENQLEDKSASHVKGGSKAEEGEFSPGVLSSWYVCPTCLLLFAWLFLDVFLVLFPFLPLFPSSVLNFWSRHGFSWRCGDGGFTMANSSFVGKK